jgi:hypothetical protein
MNELLRKLVYKTLTFSIGRERLIHLLADKEERLLLNLRKHGYLFDIGWINSVGTNTITDKNNLPLPWVTYPFIHFIDSRLNDQLAVFEYGSGNSTLYYSKKVATVDSVENDQSWFKTIKQQMPQNVNLFYCELITDGDYCRYSQQKKNYDIIIVDGRDRVNCCLQSINSLKPNGVLVLDDSERVEYTTAVNKLHENGFNKLDFWGIAPTVDYLKCTSIFYREDNCLGI